MLSVQISSTNWRVVIENTKKGLYPFVGVFRCSPFAEIIFACSCEISRASHAGRACEAREKNPYFTCFFTVSLSLFSFVQDLLFDCSRVLEYAKLRTVLHSIANYINITIFSATFEGIALTCEQRFLSSAVFSV